MQAKVLTAFFQDSARIDLTQAAAGVAGILNGSKLALFTNNPTLSENTVPADLTAPIYAGYAQVVVTWQTTLERQSNGDLALAGSSSLFAPTSSATPDTITGVAMLNSAGTSVLWAYKLTNAVPMPDKYSFMQITPFLSLKSSNANDDINTSSPLPP